MSQNEEQRKREEAPGREAAPGGGGPGGATDPNSTRDSAPGGDPARDPNPAPGRDPAPGGAAPGRDSSDGEPRAEELLVEIWGRITAFREGGGEPERLVLSMRNYRLIQNYHARLGLLENNELDYISRYEIFGLPVYVDNEIGLAVQ